MHRTMRNAKTLLASCVAVLLLAAPAHAEKTTAQEGGWGALAALGTFIYSPVKVCYATLGLVSGGLAWTFSGGDSEVLHTVLDASVRGDYVLKPSHLRGEDPLMFIGRSPEPYDDMSVAAQPQSTVESY